MPVLWLAAFGAVVLLVRRTWKASKRRRVQTMTDSEPAMDVSEDGL